MTLMTPAEAQQITRVQVSADQVGAAASVIATVTGRDIADLTLYSTADQRRIKQAIAWQSAYIAANPSILTEVAATSKSVGDVSITLEVAAGSRWLAPLARMALKKVSWRGNRTVSVGRLFDQVQQDPMLNPHPNRTYGSGDEDDTGWTQIGM